MRQFFPLSLHQCSYEYRRTAAGCGFISATFLAENICVVVGRCIHRMGFVSDYVGVLYRLGGQMRLGARFAENKQKPVFRRERGKESVIFRLQPGNIYRSFLQLERSNFYGYI